MGLMDFATRLTDGYDSSVRPFLSNYAPDSLAQFDADVQRCRRLRDGSRKELPVCVLGQSGVGKSTLLNSLLDDRRTLLPQGGIGPLTAQATSVRFSASPYFRASYLAGNRLNQLLFALERHQEAEIRRRGGIIAATASEEVAAGLSFDEIQEAESGLPPEDLAPQDEPDASATEGSQGKLEAYRSQANLLVRGKQYAALELPYLTHCLRLALNITPKTGLEVEAGDLERIEDIRRALATARTAENERFVTLDGNKSAFFGDLRTHATGHLAPLIRTIDIGWNNMLLSEGLVLVDLPGLGVANDEYRRVTAEAIRNARAVILVVDRSGFTQASADLLRTTGFLNSLLHDSHDPEADVPTLLVAVVKLDLTADDARRSTQEIGEKPRPWVDYFNEACEEADSLVRDQVQKELRRVAMEGPETTRDPLLEVVSRVVGNLRVHPVSALEYRKLFADDEEERPRIRAASDSRVPRLAAELQLIARNALEEHSAKFRHQARALHQRLTSLLEVLSSQWQAQDKRAEELDRLRHELGLKLVPLQDEYKDRRARFRGFLRETLPVEIAKGVYQATDQARHSIGGYVRSLHDYHWATLRAAVRRGGAFVGSRHIDLPNELTLRFEEPVAVVWSSQILVALRKETKAWGGDLVSLQSELVKWARGEGARVNAKRVEQIHEDLKSGVKELGAVGKEAVEELKERVRTELFSKLESSVRKKCELFVGEKRDVGPGVKRRILEHFGGDLVDTVLDVARASAQKVLLKRYEEVQTEILAVFKRFPDPLKAAAEQIVDTHELSTKRSDARERKLFAEAFEVASTALASLPVGGLESPEASGLEVPVEGA